jgi:hypothetical protein
MSVYNSLFDRIAVKYPNFQDGMAKQEYTGTLDRILKETDQILLSEVDSAQCPDTLALHASRIVSAVLDYKAAHPGMFSINTALHDSIDLAQSICLGSAIGGKDVREFREKLKEYKMDSLLSSVWSQSEDKISWLSCNPAHSAKSAEKIYYNTSTDDIFFMALAHGGVPPGLDVFLRYCTMSGSSGSQFYAVRYSIHNMSGNSPGFVPKSEANYLAALAGDRQVVLFDEDASTGQSIDRAEKLFSVIFGRGVLAVVNLDYRRIFEPDNEEAKDLSIYEQPTPQDGKKQHSMLKLCKRILHPGHMNDNAKH